MVESKGEGRGKNKDTGVGMKRREGHGIFWNWESHDLPMALEQSDSFAKASRSSRQEGIQGGSYRILYLPDIAVKDADP